MTLIYILFPCILLAIILYLAQPLRKIATKEANQKITIMFVFISVTAIGLYAALGNPNLPSRPIFLKNPDHLAQNRQMLLAQKPKIDFAIENPTDMAAQIEAAMISKENQEYEQAIEFFKKAIPLAAELEIAPVLIALYGETLTFAANGRVTLEAQEAFIQATKIAPQHPQAQFYLNLYLAQNGKVDEAVKNWKMMLEKAPNDAPWRSMLEQALKRYQQPQTP